MTVRAEVRRQDPAIAGRAGLVLALKAIWSLVQWRRCAWQATQLRAEAAGDGVARLREGPRTRRGFLMRMITGGAGDAARLREGGFLAAALAGFFLGGSALAAGARLRDAGVFDAAFLARCFARSFLVSSTSSGSSS